MLIYCTGILILLLIFTNAITDAPNAISTVVGTKVLSFRKAAYLSSIFNFVGIICMCLINFSVAKSIVGLITFNGNEGVLSVFSSIIATVAFSLVALKFGIPTSETHGILAGLLGAGMALGNLHNINLNEWVKVIIGLFWSILGTCAICKIVDFFCRKVIDNFKKNMQRKMQVFSCIIMSFMHGAQDGLKFIGIFIIYLYGIKNKSNVMLENPLNYSWIIIFVSAIMSIGVGIGGRRIVENVGNNITKLTNVDAIITDITTGLTLFVSSIFGLPVSTSHCKTVSVIAVGKKVNYKNVKDILVAWIITFPVCFLISYIITRFINLG